MSKAHKVRHESANTTLGIIHRRASGFWMDGISHGQMPFAPSGYKFYRNVRDYGATGDGTADDTAAINRAVSDGNRCQYRLADNGCHVKWQDTNLFRGSNSESYRFDNHHQGHYDPE
ncbi:hypothetical protein KXX18_007338 [Aspergillus fumigatus]|nr:hypothetical protein KXX18_007338 [Aspergillus fumigatus]